MGLARWISQFLATVAIVMLAAGCGSAASSLASASTGAPASRSPVEMAGFADATCEAGAELGLAWGNPDANIKSAVWTSFEGAIERGDAALLESSSAEVLGHIASARSALARGAGWAPGAPANAELDAVLVALKTQVTTVRDAHGDRTVATAAAATMAGVWPRWLKYIGLVLALGKDNPGALRNC